MPSSHFVDHAGFVTARRTGPVQADGTRGWVVLYDGPAQGIPADDGGRWAVLCETHGTLCQHTSQRLARATVRAGSAEFCDCCTAACGASYGACPTCGHRPEGGRDA